MRSQALLCSILLPSAAAVAPDLAHWQGSEEDGQEARAERPVKPLAIIRNEGDVLEVFGHVTVEKAMYVRYLTAERAAAEGLKPGRPSPCFAPNGELTRCTCHTWASLRSQFALVTPGFGVSDGGVETSGSGPDASPYVCFMEATDMLYPIGEDNVLERYRGDPLVDLHASIADRARKHRHGPHVYLACGTLCPAEHSVHKNVIQWPYILRAWWREGIPARISFLNFGCGAFDKIDPLHALLGLPTSLSGVCMERDSSLLPEARQRLRSHNVSFVAAAVTPRNVEDILRESYGSDTVDFLKMDIDSFDASVLRAALDVVSAGVVIAEFDRSFPPPFRFASHYSETYKTAGLVQAAQTFDGDGVPSEPRDLERASSCRPLMSLSYLVELLAGKGYFLYKMDEADAIFIHQRLAPTLEAAEEGLRFPVDEWACYMQTAMMLKPWSCPLSFTQEWMVAEDVHSTLQLMWSNVSHHARRHGLEQVPFTLDIAAGSSFS